MAEQKFDTPNNSPQNNGQYAEDQGWSPAAPGGDLDAQEQDASSGSSQSGGNAAVGASSLAGAESSGGDKVNYTGGGDNKKNAKAKQADEKHTADNAPVWKRWITKKKAAVAGGAAGGVLTIGLFGLTFVSGPLEFIHIAEILHDSHLTAGEDTGDSRVGELYRFLKAGGSVGETRIGFLQSKYHAKILGKLADIGILPEYGSLDTYQGFVVDTEHENSPYKGMTAEEAAKAFAEKTGVTPTAGADGKLRVTAKTYWTQRKSLKASLNQLGDSKVATAVRARIMGKFGFVTWHPLKILDKKVNNTLVKLVAAISEKWKNRIGKGTQAPVGVDASKSTQGTDQNGNPAPTSSANQQVASNTPSNPQATSQILDSLKNSKGLKITGGVAALAGLVCALKAVNDNVALIRYTQIIVPLIRMGMDAITVGYQLMAGRDVDPYELQVLSKNFYTTDKTTGKTTTWYDNIQIRKDVNDKGGIDTMKQDGTRDLITQSSIPWLAWTENPVLGGVCSTAGSVITGVVSIGIGVISGGLVSTVVGLVGSVALAGPVIDGVAHLLAGDAIDPTIGANKGPKFGGYIDEGAMFGANAQAISMGGTAMTPAQVHTVQVDAQDEQMQQFQSKGIFARIFDVNDYHSLTGRLADNIGPTGYTNVNNWLNGVINSFGSVLSLPFNLASSTAHASNTQTAYFDYGVPIYGFSKEDQGNTAVEDPYANAETAASILDKNNTGDTPNWIQKAHDCFGVTISKSAQGWDAVPDTDVDVYDTNNYKPADCAGPQLDNSGKITTAARVSIDPALTDHPITAQTAATPVAESQALDWFRIRFFILDTSVMEGYACANFNDEQSCINDDMSTASATADSTTLTSASLASQLLSDSKVTLSDSAKADLQTTASNKQVTPGPVASGAQCTQTPVFLNAQLLQGLVNVAKNYSFTIDNLVSGHACDNTRHPLGRAADITQLNKAPINWSGDNLVADKKFASDVATTMYNIMPTGTIVNGQPINMAGVGVCHQDDIAPPPVGINYFTYQCDRLLVDVGIQQ